MNAIAHAPASRTSGSKLDNRRVLAAIVDLVVVGAGAAVILVAGDSLSGDRQSALSAVILGWALYYFFALESGEGQTLGKRLTKIRVVRADGRPAGMGEIAVRTVLRVVDNYLVGLIVMLATGERRQRIGDLAAGTIVVDAAVPAAAPPAPEVAAAEPVEDEVEADEPASEVYAEDLAASQTITLPSRPAPPATLADLAPEALVAEVEEAPVVEVEPEPVVEVEPEEELPPVTSPSLEELAHDVAAVHVAVEQPEEDEVEQPEEDVAEEQPEADVAEEQPEADVAEEQPEDDEPVLVNPLETISAMDLVMGSVSEQDSSESSSESAQDAEDPASA